MCEVTKPEEMKRVVRVYHDRRHQTVTAEWIDEEESSHGVRWNIGQDADDKLIVRTSEELQSLLAVLATVTGRRYRVSKSLSRGNITVWEREDIRTDAFLAPASPSAN